MKKAFLASLILTIASFSAVAQSQLIPTPASSTGGSGFAVVAITPMILPSDICTASNGNCYSASSLPPTQTGTLTFRHVASGHPPPGGFANLWNYDELSINGKVVSEYNFVCANCSN